MFDKAKVTDKLNGLVGIKNPINPSYAIVDASNQTSRSGRFATENPYFKVEYLIDTQSYVDASDIEINDFLKGLQSRSIAEVVDNVTIDEDYIDHQMLYKNANNKTDIDTLPGSSFVGYKIEKSIDNNVAVELNRVVLEFEGAGDIEILLFNSNVKTPIQTKTVTISSYNQIEELNWKLDNSGSYYGGDYYIGYLTDGLTVQPIKRDYNSSNIKSIITHTCLSNINVPNVTTNELFDLDNIDGSAECWGLNLDVSVYNDYTDLVINNERLFAPAIQLQMVVNGIQEYISSSRSNDNQMLSESQLNVIIAQLEGIPDRITGIIPTLSKEVESLNMQVNKLIKGMFPKGFELNTLT
jgi:hypothetical protein